MSDSPLVSIALCVFNGEKFLHQQLDSILVQTYKNLEIVIVDDCSTDESRNILNRYRDKYPQIILYFNDYNLGYVKNFEKAISLCNGELIALSDHDDIWHKEKIFKQVSEIGENLLIYHDSLYIDEKGKSLNTKMSDILNLYEGNSPLPLVLKNCVSGHSIMFKRALIPLALPFDRNFFHDWRLAFVAANIGSIKCIRETLVQYRQHVNNTVDFLSLKGETVKPAFYNPLVTEKEWVRNCSKFKGPYQCYILQISSLLDAPTSIYKRIKLLWLLYRESNTLLYIDKIPEKHKKRVLRRMVRKLQPQ